jgi:hypothetical protein
MSDRKSYLKALLELADHAIRHAVRKGKKDDILKLADFIDMTKRELDDIKAVETQEQEEKNKKIQRSAQKIMGDWPEWKQEYGKSFIDALDDIATR